MGVTPLTNYYMVYGKHSIKSSKNRYQYDKEVNIERDDNTSLYLDMEDMSKYYVNVTFKVDGNAEIHYKDVKRGVGEWKQEFYQGKYEITIYTSCCNATRGIYYYTTYDNHQITAVDMHREDLDGAKLVHYPLCKSENIYTQN